MRDDAVQHRYCSTRNAFFPDWTFQKRTDKQLAFVMLISVEEGMLDKLQHWSFVPTLLLSLPTFS